MTQWTGWASRFRSRGEKRPARIFIKVLQLASASLALNAVPLPASSPPATPLSVSTLAARVDGHYNHLTSLRARYTERYQGLGLDRSETGTLTLRKPGRMRWAYDTPAGKIFLLDGKTAISYTPGDTQAQRIPARQLDDLRSPLRFLLGHTQLAKELDSLTLTPLDAQLYTLGGVPKGMSQRLRSLAITVDSTGVIHSIRTEEIDGATTTFTFTGMTENIPTVPADFAFTPPPGVSISNGPAPI